MSYSTKIHVSNRFKIVKETAITPRFILKHEIGKGSFSNVYEAYDIVTESLLAIKAIKNNKKIKDASLNEIRILSKLKHKKENNILEMYGHFNLHNHLFIVSKLYSENMKEYMSKHTLQHATISKLFKQLLNALTCLETNTIVHRDLKPENILFKDSNYNSIVLIDFSLSQKQDSTCYDCNYTVQTIPYRAPEIYLEKHYDSRLDIWSLGCILYEMYFNTILFDCNTTIDLFIKHNVFLNPPEASFINTFSNHFKELYDCIESPNYIKKNTIYTFKRNNFIKDTMHCPIIDIIFKCLSWNINDRPYARDLS